MPQFRGPSLTSLCMLGAVVLGQASLVRGDDAAAMAPRLPAQQTLQQGDYMDPMRQWLDEVRAQRQAWEARRQAAKDAVNARRRLNDPWGAAEHEAREKESQRRRDAMLERAERDRDAFLGQSPWENANLWESGPPPPLPGQHTTPEAPPQPDAGGSNNPAPSPAQTPGEQRGDPAPYSPSGWDNRWYYRGY